MRKLATILLITSSLATWAQVQAPLQTFISGGVATGANHPSTNIPTHFSNFGQPFFLPRTATTQNGGGVANAVEIMFNAPPEVVSRVPSMDATGVPTNSDLSMTFDEPIAIGTGEIVIRQLPENTVWVSFEITLPNVATVSGTTLTLNPGALPASKELYVVIPSGAVLDLDGSPFAGYSDATGWKFTTGGSADITPPTVDILSPADNATDVAVNTSLTITFSEAVVKAPGTITIWRSDDTVLDQIDIPTETSVSGNVVTIDPPDLPELTALYVTISSGGFLDVSGNAYTGINDVATWNFTTVGDTNPPQPQTLSPLDNATGVTSSSDLSIVFTEPVQKGTATITIRRVSDNAVVQSLALADDVTVNGATVTLNPPDDLPHNTALYVSIPAGTFEDQAGNDFAGITDPSTWNFTTAVDVTAPQVTVKNPTMDETGVAINRDMILTFNEPIAKGTGDIFVRRFSDDAALHVITVTTSQVIASGSTLTIQTNDFQTNTQLYVIIPGGAITDLAGNPFAGYSNNTGWRFTTSSSADVNPPIVNTLSPANGVSNVPINTDLVITFNENVVRGPGTIFIRKSDNTVVDQFDIMTETDLSGNVVTINPIDLPELTQLHVTVPNGGFLDPSGNAFAGINGTWSFTTVGVPPEVQSFSPADGTTGIPVNSNLVITFTEAVQEVAGTITIRKVSDNSIVQSLTLADHVTTGGTTATIDPPVNLPYNTPLYVSIPAGTFEDAAGNDFAGFTDTNTWNFTTAPDTSPPTAQPLAPIDGATGVLISANLQIQFNEVIRKGTGTITINRVSDGFAIQTISLANDVAIDAPGIIVTINPPTDLPFNGSLYVSIPPGTFEDEAGNDFAGFEDAATWNFTTELDVTAPFVTVTGKNPAMDETNVPVNADLILTFNEPITKGSGTIQIMSSPGNTPLGQPINLANDVQTSGTFMTINPPDDIGANQEVWVKIPSGTVLDLAGNSFAGYSDVTGWKFRTKAGTDRAAQIAATVPPDNAFGVATNGSLIVIFDEPVTKGNGTVYLVRATDHTVVEQFDVETSARISVSGTTVMIDPSADFEAGTALYIIIPNTAFKDGAFNPSQGIYLSTTWNFTTAASPDLTPPLVQAQGFTPADGATGVLITTNLSIAFNEPVVTRSGSVSVRKVSDGTPVQTVLASTFSGSGTSNVTVNLPNDLAWNGQYFVTIASDAFEDLAGNDFAGFSDASTWNFNTQQDPTGPIIAVSPAPLPATSNALALINVSATITDPESGVKGAFIEWRTLGAATTAFQSKKDLSGNGQLWTSNIEAAWVKDGGVEYQITAENNAGGTTIYGPKLVRINSTGNGLKIPYTAWGKKKENYRIVTVPLVLTSPSVEAVFADDLGPQKDKKWRVARYENQKTIQDFTGNMEPGKGYWLIAAKSVENDIFSGPGTTIDATSQGRATIKLTTGWNQIGNPYNFPIRWADVTGLPVNTGLSTVLRTYREGKPDNGSGLKTMEGGFVNHIGPDLTIQIPPIKDPTAARDPETMELRNTLDQPDWDVVLTLEQGDMQNVISGVGMRSGASIGIDVFDGVNMPRFDDYLEVSHPKSFNGFTYSMDIVPSADSHIWAFSIESSLHEDDMSFTWDNSYFGSNGKELVLWDEDLQRPINMKLNSGYNFDRNRTKNFRVIFGDQAFTEEHTQVKRLVIHQVYPNPAAADLAVSLGVPADEWVSVEVHDLLGRRLTTFFEGRLEKGHHEIQWDRAGDEPVGLYLIVAKAGDQLATAKVILK